MQYDPEDYRPQDNWDDERTLHRRCFAILFVIVIASLCWLAESPYNPVGPILTFASDKVMDPVFKYLLPYFL